MSLQDIDKNFVSTYDKFLRQWDKENNVSLSQEKEINKHKRIAALRDNARVDDTKKTIWENF